MGLIEPLYLYLYPTNFIGYSVIVSLHLYHCIFFNLNKQDIFHHILFVLIGCGYTILYQPYIASSMPLVSLHGIPGMIDYFLLFLVHIGKFELLEQKRISSLLNTWFRGPFSVYICGLAYTSILYHKRYECIFCVIIVFLNESYLNE